MKVKIHTLFQYLLDTTEAEPEAFVGFSLSEPPRLGEFMDALDPDLPLDWNQKSFRGLPALRERVLEQAGLAGLCRPDDVLITAGAAEANYLAFMQLVQPGDEVVTERPGWPQVGVLADAVGANLKQVDRDEASGWSLPFDALEAAVTDRTRMIFLTNPNNPTGRLMSRQELERVVQIAERTGADHAQRSDYDHGRPGRIGPATAARQFAVRPSTRRAGAGSGAAPECRD